MMMTMMMIAVAAAHWLAIKHTKVIVIFVFVFYSIVPLVPPISTMDI